MTLRLLLRASAIAVTIWATGGQARAQDLRGSPEGGSGWRATRGATAKSHMVAAANSAAAEAGVAVLREGGSAADAAIAVQLVLNLVEPQSSGLGGGAFILYWDGREKKLEGHDGRETAPAAATPDRFLREGRPRAFVDAVLSGASVGVPGTLRVLEALHRRHGRLPWARLFAPATSLATDGFLVSPRLHLLLRWHGMEGFSPAARAYFFDTTGSARPAGHLLRNPELAATFRTLAERGPEAFYSGAVAEGVVAGVHAAPSTPGDLTLADLAGYRAKERAPVCVAYRGYRVCGMGPPSSGGPAVAQILKLLEPFDLGQGPGDAMNARALHLIAEAEKLAFADRDAYIADPDFVAPPSGLLDARYLDTRRAMIGQDTAMARPAPGTPPRSEGRLWGDDTTVEIAGTSHFSIVDGEGNALAMTTTIEAGFGSRLWAAGFLLNNELTDFAFTPTDRAGRPLANRVEGGKRPRSSMAPTIVFDPEGKPWAVLGSAGGSRIILYVVKALVALIDWKLDVQTATGLMNFGSRGGAFEIEVDHASAVWHALKMKPYGHRVSADLLTSGTHAIVIRKAGLLEGGADPRREGVALGD